MEAIVHNMELRDPWGKKFVRGDKVWESPDFVKKLLRLRGTLINNGTEICNVETHSGGVIPFLIPTSFPIGVRSLWQKRVYFVLGFSWAGIKAYDVRSEIPNPVCDHPQSLSKNPPTNRKPTESNRTSESFVEKLNDIRKHIEEIEKEKTGKGVGKERVILIFFYWGGVGGVGKTLISLILSYSVIGWK